MVDVAPVPSRWEEQALERTLAPARARSAVQVRRLVAAARELAAECGSDFTVGQVAARAGLSSKTLYRSFSGKDALLLAVCEEDNLAGAAALAAMIDEHEAPVDRIRAYIRGLFALSTGVTDEAYIGLVMREYFRLAQQNSEQVEHVLAPFIDLLAGELSSAAAADAIRSEDVRRDARAVFLLAVSHLCPLVLSGAHSDPAETADFVAGFCLRALGSRA
jgi:AcrR family transcriptional regulator